MADKAVPHFHNQDGVRVIHVGSKEFMCIGALPPFDHPHVFLDMGAESEIICQYCSTLYRYRSDLKAGTADPAASVWDDRARLAAE
ncbi:zinc-finger domain-containing protein [Methylobacterium oryzisoli]|uniref:zinc-finger domain-containing protein n=1 Tax=Methylobacterium oryzisoli TaxID=3385502 RepID=UPI0038923148